MKEKIYVRRYVWDKEKNMAEEKVLSPQEERIKYEQEHKVIKFNRPGRAARILSKVRSQKPQIDVERGLYFTQSFKETEGQPLILRWAKALFAYTPLSDGSSASQGSDLNGPTAILLSNYATKNYNHNEHAGRLLNIKLSPSCVRGEEGTKKLVQFIEAWRDLKLWHVQFNVLNTDTLRAAQEHPENYRNLLVRIAGYSAYFTELTKDLQDDIISRTEHEAV